jgi:hypothetical protein
MLRGSVMKQRRTLAIFLLSLVTATFAGAICGDPSPSNSGQTTTPPADGTPQSVPTISAEKIAATAQTATSFGEFSLFWLGSSYDSDGDGVGDMPLSAAYYLSGEAVVNPRTGAVISPAQRSFILAYGTCRIPKGRSQCGTPIGIVIEPPDNQSPPLAGVEGQVAVRGVYAATYDGGALYIKTADVTITIMPSFASDGDEKLNQSLRIANQLLGANAKAAGITKDTDFRPVPGAAAPPTSIPGVGATSMTAAKTATPPLSQPTIPASPTTVNIAVGLPSLVGSKVYVPVITTGSGAVYSGFSVHLRWDRAVFSSSPADSSGSTLEAPFCPAPILDSDGGGATYSCIATGGLTKATGLLTTIVLSPAGSGCSALHLFTYGDPDGGDAITGTFLVDAGSSKPLAAQYVDGSASVDGKTC